MGCYWQPVVPWGVGGLQVPGGSAAAHPPAAARLPPPPAARAGRRGGEHRVLEMESWVSAAGSAPGGYSRFAGSKAMDAWDTGSPTGPTEGRWGVSGGRSLHSRDAGCSVSGMDAAGIWASGPGCLGREFAARCRRAAWRWCPSEKANATPKTPRLVEGESKASWFSFPHDAPAGSHAPTRGTAAAPHGWAARPLPLREVLGGCWALGRAWGARRRLRRAPGCCCWVEEGVGGGLR